MDRDLQFVEFLNAYGLSFYAEPDALEINQQLLAIFRGLAEFPGEIKP